MDPRPTPARRDPQTPPEPPPEPGTQPPETTAAEERGERHDTGKAIARGGKTDGHVPGAEPDE